MNLSTLKNSLFVFVFLTFACPLLAQDKVQVVDLTHPFNGEAIYWPTERGFKMETIFKGMTPDGYFYSANKFCTPEHGGTHVDAPNHFARNKKTVDEIPVENLAAHVFVIDIKDKVGNTPAFSITKEIIQEWEKKNKPLKANHFVFFNTGWARHWGDKKNYLGSDRFEDVHNLNFPGLSEDAAHYLVSKKILAVGLDTASLDRGDSKDFKAHRILLGANIYGVENLSNLDQLPPTGAFVVVAPMKIEGGSGAPARILAFIGEKP